MKKLLLAFSSTASALMIAGFVPLQGAFAAATCEQQVRIRCSGYSYNGQPPIEGYSSVNECVAAETPIQCPAGLSMKNGNKSFLIKVEHVVDMITA